MLLIYYTLCPRRSRVRSKRIRYPSGVPYTTFTPIMMSAPVQTATRRSSFLLTMPPVIIPRPFTSIQFMSACDYMKDEMAANNSLICILA